MLTVVSITPSHCGLLNPVALGAGPLVSELGLCLVAHLEGASLLRRTLERRAVGWRGPRLVRCAIAKG